MFFKPIVQIRSGLDTVGGTQRCVCIKWFTAGRRYKMYTNNCYSIQVLISEREVECYIISEEGAITSSLRDLGWAVEERPLNSVLKDL